MIKALQKYLNRDQIFPLNKVDGKYPIIYSEKGKNLRCPYCGFTSWSIKSYSEIECNNCYHQFINFGTFGLEPINEKNEVVKQSS